MGREWHLSRSMATQDRDTPGCMAGMLQYLDFHRLLFSGGRSGRPSTDTPPAPRARAARGGGVFVAPRNSLEDSPPALEFEDIPTGIQISRPSGGRAVTAGSESETPRTPSTPSLVARLMGFEGLPDALTLPSPAHSSAQKSGGAKREERCKKKTVINDRRQPLRIINVDLNAGTRSLPDTPRPSSSRPSWDLDPKRLSLQMHSNNKENNYDRRSLPPSPSTAKARRDQERLRDDAREIVKQAKENICNRRAGICTGTKSTTLARKQGAENAAGNIFDEKYLLLASPSSSAPATETVAAHVRSSTLAEHIPNLRKLAKPSGPPPPKQSADLDRKMAMSKCKKDGCERYRERIKKPSRPPPPPPTMVPPNPQIFRLHGQEVVKQMISLTPSAAVSSTTAIEVEYKYVRAILDRGGLMQRSSIAGFRAYSSSAPVDPIVFHRVELDIHNDADGRCLLGNSRIAGPLQHRWNRKLLFHLVEEILADVLRDDCARPYIHNKPTGEVLLRRVWSRIRSMARADCRVLGDIDTLVAGDITAAAGGVFGHRAVVGEYHVVAEDLVRRLLDGLVGELAREVDGRYGGGVS